MHDGVLDQLGTPSEIYESPKTRFVATFIGETNTFDGCIRSIDGEHISIMIENGNICGCGNGFALNEYITVSVRPEKMKYSDAPVNGFTINAIVKDYVYVGSVIKCIASLPNGNEIKIERLAGEELPKLGSSIYIYWEEKDAVLIHNQDQLIFQAVDSIPLG